VLIALAWHADRDGSEVRPSIARVAWETGLSARQVQRILNGPKGRPDLGLIGRGVLVRVRPPGHHQPATYRLVLSRLVRKPAFVSGVHMGDTASPITPSRMGDIGGVMGDNEAGMGDIATSPEPSLEPSFEPSSPNYDFELARLTREADYRTALHRRRGRAS